MGTVISRRLTRDMPDRSRIVARLEMRPHGASGNLSPAFSTTGEIYYAHGTWSGAAQQRNGREWDCGGCCHEAILQAFPKLAGFVDMHLADPITGEPMHAERDGWYFFAGSRANLRAATRYNGFQGIYSHKLAEHGLSDDDRGRETYCYQVACKLLRVSDIPSSITVDLDNYGTLASPSEARRRFAAWIDTLRPTWKREADDARTFIESLPKTA